MVDGAEYQRYSVYQPVETIDRSIYVKAKTAQAIVEQSVGRSIANSARSVSVWLTPEEWVLIQERRKA